MSNDIFTIPKENNELRSDITKRKKKYMMHLVNTFENYIKENRFPSKLNVFKFKETNLEIIIKEKSYISNLENLLDYFVKEEEYEVCQKITNIIRIINKQ